MSESLRVAVPSPDAPWAEVPLFALSINGYEDPYFVGNHVGDIANQAHHSWRLDRRLPDDLLVLRGILFFEQRRSGKGLPLDFDVKDEWNSAHPRVAEWVGFVKDLLRKIHLVSGGTVEVREERWELWASEPW